MVWLYISFEYVINTVTEICMMSILNTCILHLCNFTRLSSWSRCQWLRLDGSAISERIDSLSFILLLCFICRWILTSRPKPNLLILTVIAKQLDRIPSIASLTHFQCMFWGLDMPDRTSTDCLLLLHWRGRLKYLNITIMFYYSRWTEIYCTCT